MATQQPGWDPTRHWSAADGKRGPFLADGPTRSQPRPNLATAHPQPPGGTGGMVATRPFRPGSGSAFLPGPKSDAQLRQQGRRGAEQWRRQRYIRARGKSVVSHGAAGKTLGAAGREAHLWGGGFAKGMVRGSVDANLMMLGVMASPVAGAYEFAGIGIGRASGNNYWKSTGAYAGTNAAGKPLGWQGQSQSKWGAVKGIGGKALMGPAFAAYSLHLGASAVGEGYDRGGMVGAAGAGAQFGLTTALIGVGIHGIHRGGRAMFGGMGGNITAARAAYAGSGGGAAGYRSASIVGRAFWGAKIAGGAANIGRGLKAGRAIAKNPLTYAFVEGAYQLGSATIGEAYKRYERFNEGLETYHRGVGVGTQGNLAAFMTQGAWTSRQMSVQAIQRSHMNARNALGNEAQYMHRMGY